MDYLWIIITIAAVTLLASFLIIRLINQKRANVENIRSEKNLLPIKGEEAGVEQNQDFEITIPIEILPATTQFDEKSLFEITDSTVVARISELIPFTAQTGTRVSANKAINSLTSTELLKADIPFSQLTKSKDVVGAARGYMHGGKGVAAQANLTKIDMTNVTKASTVANGVANVMNVGSLVVGQYYMSEISSKLETMTKSIDKIGDFQDREFKSRILSVITLVGEISQFSSEIMEDDEQRKLKLASLDNLKATATELLGQINITISDTAKTASNPDYEEYQAKVGDFQKLVGYQNALITVLEEISKLIYLLAKGLISTEMSYSTFNKYFELSVQTRTLLGKWHDRQTKALGIDVEKERIAKTGFGAVVSAIPGLIDEKFKYNELSESLIKEISTQTKNLPEAKTKPKEVYDNDVEIIIKDGKCFYLHESLDSTQKTEN